MPKNDKPPRPNDLFGAMFWDMFYGPGSETNPFNQLGRQIDGIKEDLKSTLTIAKSIDGMNSTMKETNALIKETNNTLKTIADGIK